MYSPKKNEKACLLCGSGTSCKHSIKIRGKKSENDNFVTLLYNICGENVDVDFAIKADTIACDTCYGKVVQVFNFFNVVRHSIVNRVADLRTKRCLSTPSPIKKKKCLQPKARQRIFADIPNAAVLDSLSDDHRYICSSVSRALSDHEAYTNCGDLESNDNTIGKNSAVEHSYSSEGIKPIDDIALCELSAGDKGKMLSGKRVRSGALFSTKLCAGRDASVTSAAGKILGDVMKM